jgi:DNA primase
MALLEAKTLDDIRSIPIKELAERLGIELGRGRANARCFNSEAHKHGDKNGSLGFNEHTNRFKCFACEVNGDTIALTQAVTGKGFKEACEHIADLHGIQLTTKQVKTASDNTPNFNRKTPYTSHSEAIRINDSYEYDALPHSEIYQALYDASDEPNTELLNWWHTRGYSDDLLKASGWRTVGQQTITALLERYSEAELTDSGLVWRDDAGRLSNVLNTHTVVTPYFNGELEAIATGQTPNVLYIRFRTLQTDSKAKYLAPRGTQAIIYGFDELYRYATEYGATPTQLYITESETDALAVRELASRRGKRVYAAALTGGQKSQHSRVVRELVHFLSGLDKQAVINIVTDRDKTGEVFYNAVASSLYKAGFNANNLIKWQEWHGAYKDVGEHLQALNSQSKQASNRTDATDKTINKSED